MGSSYERSGTCLQGSGSPSPLQSCFRRHQQQHLSFVNPVAIPVALSLTPLLRMDSALLRVHPPCETVRHRGILILHCLVAVTLETGYLSKASLSQSVE